MGSEVECGGRVDLNGKCRRVPLIEANIAAEVNIELVCTPFRVSRNIDANYNDKCAKVHRQPDGHDLKTQLASLLDRAWFHSLEKVCICGTFSQ